jgi:tetratricopeptide (TPR) repeat protein
MNKVVLAALVILSVLVSCNAKKDWSKKKIEQQENALMEQAKKGTVDSAAVNKLLADYEAYAEADIADTNGANYLFKAADFYRYMHKPLRSIELYSKIYAHYPTIAKRPYALFLQGFMFENEVGNVQAARNLYQKFLDEYPTHPIAKDVRTTLDNLGKTPEQLIQEFQANAAKDSVAQAGK